MFYNPLHPYTKGLLGAVPGPDIRKDETRLVTIPGAPPDLRNPPAGCAFFPRCRHALRVCARLNPNFSEEAHQHTVRCWLYSPMNPRRLSAGQRLTGEVR
ncbi:MAG: oligopeptide/dipeptide ABC transporter ATP-binding protein [Candidatus Kryptoniota bacterium]